MIAPDPAEPAATRRGSPWFVGNGRCLMVGVLGSMLLLALVLVAIGSWSAERWYRWSRLPIPTVLPRTLPRAAYPAYPDGNQGDWFPQDSYPAAARRAGDEGRVSVALLVGEDGRATACEVLQSSTHASLDEATCRLAVCNGRFHPARDASGRPVPARFAMRGVVWRLED